MLICERKQHVDGSQPFFLITGKGDRSVLMQYNILCCDSYHPAGRSGMLDTYEVLDVGCFDTGAYALWIMNQPFFLPL